MPSTIDDLNLLRSFATVAESASFTGAAERLGMAKARVSLQVGRLEAALGERLFHRTTRRVGLTDAGQRLFDECAPLLLGLETALRSASGHAAELTGRLRVGATVEHASQTLAAEVAAFARRHPRLQVELMSSDRRADLVREGIDVTVRMGWLRDSSQRAVRLSDFDQGVVASPDYLRRHGAPTAPDDLARHEWLALTLLPAPLTWTFTPTRGDPVAVRMLRSRLRTDSSATLRAWLVQGEGISVLNLMQVARELREGSLVRLLPQWSLPRGGVHAVYAPGRQRAPAAVAFVEWLRERLADPQVVPETHARPARLRRG